jgi:hypothetical protein
MRAHAAIFVDPQETTLMLLGGFNVTVAADFRVWTPHPCRTVSTGLLSDATGLLQAQCFVVAMADRAVPRHRRYMCFELSLPVAFKLIHVLSYAHYHCVTGVLIPPNPTVWVNVANRLFMIGEFEMSVLDVPLRTWSCPTCKKRTTTGKLRSSRAAMIVVRILSLTRLSSAHPLWSLPLPDIGFVLNTLV